MVGQILCIFWLKCARVHVLFTGLSLLSQQPSKDNVVTSWSRCIFFYVSKGCQVRSGCRETQTQHSQMPKEWKTYQPALSLLLQQQIDTPVLNTAYAGQKIPVKKKNVVNCRLQQCFVCVSEILQFKARLNKKWKNLLP